MKNVVLGILISLLVHGTLALALLAYFRHAPRFDAPASLDLSHVDLSFAEEDDDRAAVAPAPPSGAEPPLPPPRPVAAEPPPTPEAPVRPRPPDPVTVQTTEPGSFLTVMETHAPRFEASAAAPRQARVDAPPRPRRTIHPDYPKSARRRGDQGEVTLEIAVSASGIVTEARVAGSSGFADLDAAAVSAVRAARFIPARAEDRPVASTVRLKFAFRLK